MNPENIQPSKHKRCDEAFKQSGVELAFTLAMFF
jgi:hypothetical protein